MVQGSPTSTHKNEERMDFETGNYMTVDFEQIKEQLDWKRLFQDTGDLLFKDNYTDPTHFIFELLQNAEDAMKRRADQWTGSRAISFKLTKDKLRVGHFGNPFNKSDIRGICNVGKSTKNEPSDIGHFGIGFKSVYVYTDQPEIHSGLKDFAVDFKINNYVQPTSVQPINRNPDETVFIFPFKSGEEDKSYKEISEALENLESRTLLFLHEIEEIRWDIEDYISGSCRRESEHINDSTRRVRIIEKVITKEEEYDGLEKWLIFSRQVTDKDENPAGDVEIAFKVDTESDTIVSVHGSPLVVFFPTVEKTGLKFVVQGPYQTTPNRETIPPNKACNKYLVEQTALLLRNALCWMRDENILDIDVLNILPLRQIIGMFESLYTSVKQILLSESLLPSLEGEYISANEALIGSTRYVRELLSTEQLSVIYGTKRELSWISSDITQDRRTRVLYDYILKGKTDNTRNSSTKC